MEIKTREIVSAARALNHLAGQKIKNQKIYYWVTVTQRKLQDHLEAFERVRNNLLVEYAVPDPKNKTQFVFEDAKQRVKFNELLDEILDQVETLDIHTINLSLLFEASNTETNPLDITPEQVVALGPLVNYDMET